MVDDFFAGKINIVENSISRRVTNFEAIVVQLWIKVMAGNKRAMNVFLKYQEFAASRGGMGGVRFEFVIADANEDEGGGKIG